jgi:hypothetical protein
MMPDPGGEYSGEQSSRGEQGSSDTRRPRGRYIGAPDESSACGRAADER